MRSSQILESASDEDILENALDRLRLSSSGTPNGVDCQAVSYVKKAVAHGDLNIEDALPEICVAAVAWRDIQLWDYAFKKCVSNPFERLLEFDVVESALATLGNEVVLPRYEQFPEVVVGSFTYQLSLSIAEALSREADTIVGLNILEQLADVKVVPRGWILQQRTRVIAALHPECLLVQDLNILMRTAGSLDGIHTLANL